MGAEIFAWAAVARRSADIAPCLRRDFFLGTVHTSQCILRNEFR
jgi:hypothetical protein